MEPIRFQVNKRVEAALKKHHPWIYRNQCSSALQALPIGSLVRVVGTGNQFLGIGLYDPHSAIAIRIFSFEDVSLSEEFFLKKIHKAHHKRLSQLSSYKTNAYRLLHGEADGFPGVTMDVYGDKAVVVFYLKSWQDFLSPVLKVFAGEIGLKHVFTKPPKGDSSSGTLHNLLTASDEAIEEPLWFIENDCDLPCYPVSGLKTGFFLDLREVRRTLPDYIPDQGRVLNLFANDGALSAIALSCGAKQVTSVERHDVGATHARELFARWELKFSAKDWIMGDAWEFLENTPGKTDCDLIILDPPSLASKKDQHHNLKQAWEFLHNKALQHLKPGGHLVSISCTERLSRDEQIQWTLSAGRLTKHTLTLVEELPITFDHPEIKPLPERNYFRAMVWKNG